MQLTPAAIALLSDPEKEQAAVVERVLRPYLMHLNQIVERLIDINDHIEDTEVGTVHTHQSWTLASSQQWCIVAAFCVRHEAGHHLCSLRSQAKCTCC